MKLSKEHKSRSKRNSPLRPDWAKLIKQKRSDLGETQEQFGKRFGVSRVAVALWETGENDPPGKVTWWITHTEAGTK